MELLGDIFWGGGSGEKSWIPESKFFLKIIGCCCSNFILDLIYIMLCLHATALIAADWLLTIFGSRKLILEIKI